MSGRNSSCDLIFHPETSDSTEDDAVYKDEIEHVAGPGCICGKEYSGYRILVEEMKGCRDMQCLLTKEDIWMPEPDD